MKTLILVLALVSAPLVYAQDASTFPTIRDYVESQKPVVTEFSGDQVVEVANEPSTHRHSSSGGRRKVVTPTLTDEQFQLLLNWLRAVGII